MNKKSPREKINRGQRLKRENNKSSDALESKKTQYKEEGPK